MHKLLATQIKRHLKEMKEIPSEWNEFIEAISMAYLDAEDDYELMERAMNISSEELMEKNSTLMDEISKRKQVEDKLQTINLELEQRVKIRTKELNHSNEQLNFEINKLNGSESRIRTIMNSVIDGIITIDENGIIESINPAAVQIFGYSAQEVLGKNVSCLMPEPYASEHDNYLKQYISSRESKIIGVGREVMGMAKTGKTFPMDLAINEMRIGEKLFFVGIVRDITERKKAENEILAAKVDAEVSNQAKSKFLSQMSHELRTPMNAILGFGQLLEYDTKEPLSDSQKERVDEILKAGNHLLKLINEVLDLSRIESGQLNLSVEDILVANAIDDALSLISPLAAERNIQITNHLSNHPKLSIRADLTRFKQVLLNLLSNAVKYNRDGGSITLDFQKTGNDGVRIDITDTGEGISEDNQKLLFQPFHRLETNSSAIEGTGIGLTITKHLIEMMDGTVSVQSTPGKGSQFSIVFAVGKQLTSAGEDRVISPSQKTPGRTDGHVWTLLYVEDNSANLMLVEQILLSRSDIKLLSAPQARMGIELARAHKPDLILMDINMPEMDGITAMKKLQNYEETREIPVIAVSANAMESDIKKALAAGFKGYITKPFDIPKLFIEIDRFLKPENLTLVDKFC